MSNGPDAQLGTWLAVGVLIGLALALLLGVLAVGVRRARRLTVSHARRQSTTAVQPPGTAPGGPRSAYEIDDLPGFAEHPPGSAVGPRTLPPAPHADRTGVIVPGRSTSPGGPDAGRTGTAAVGVAVLLLVGAVVVAFAGGGPVASAQSQQAAVAPSPSATVLPTPALPAQQEAAAGALAFESVPLGEDGFAASATFQGVVLEQRAVGLTVTYPSVSVTTDGRHALAHVRLPTFNCLTTEPPADPVAAGCIRSLTEYADLAGPQLQVSRSGDQVELAGLFPTYTRPNGSAPSYTGRAYSIAASITPARSTEAPAPGSARGTGAPVPAVGVVRIGTGSAETTTDRGVNLIELPG